MAQVEFSYRHRAVHSRQGKGLLGPVELSFSSPALVVVSGNSGSGKSTLLRAAAGLVEAEGAERILGGRTYSAGELPLWRSRVSLLMQDAPVLDASVEENLTFPFRLKNAGQRSFDPEEAGRLLSAVHLDQLQMDSAAARLSGGERHRLCLVRGLLWAPDVLLADEPLSGLEPELADRCFHLLKDFVKKRDRIVICVLHERRFAEMADYRLVVKDGRIH